MGNLSSCCQAANASDKDAEVIMNDRAYIYHKWQLDVEKEEDDDVERPSVHRVR